MNTVVRLKSRLAPADAPYPQDRLDDLFAGFFRPLADENRSPESIKLEVTEDDKAYHVAAAIAGAKKDEINVAVDKNRVSIAAEIKREHTSKDGERLLHSERFYGKASRVFTVAVEIDEDAVQARFADGILVLTLPKKVPAAARRINIA